METIYDLLSVREAPGGNIIHGIGHVHGDGFHLMTSSDRKSLKFRYDIVGPNTLIATSVPFRPFPALLVTTVYSSPLLSDVVYG
ncbi:MAG: hypothetical protein LKF70_05840 [Prevotella sp.]|nr:hypothetical protein [Prevotella sp.]MCH4240325.1 hypothetical protein [Prevotella sp.]